MGYPPAEDASFDDIGFAFFNVFHRLIEPRPRRVHFAHSCWCPPELYGGYSLVLGKISAGGDLRPHLSRGIDKADYHDGMLNDWGISHLHLGERLRADGFIDRTGPVLYARFDRDDAYLIGVLEHGKWAAHKLIDAIHSNWPHLLLRHELKGITPPSSPLPEKVLKRLRKGGVSVMLNVAGKAIAPPGGGYSCSGESLRVITESDRYFYAVRGLERSVREQIRTIVEQASAKGLQLPDPLVLRLRIDHDGRASAEAECGTTLLDIDLGLIATFAYA